ncbi:alpha-ketoglutarate decarboxylase [Meridianimaribacter sp. CL38]|uniref:alpha-ketoglutarate decarboxylase n=1 Tax=Meridianimaribacter sp. CL38 TaxID=2213021 RepID=UPI0010388C9C|nr:alpha-ketoglutarate decarboxylase [Meridianimaribacter sp. CL38]TBV25195.1 alpha-ketoglutarate decarboxylase [Meridianimaribacter sp. CL38]
MKTFSTKFNLKKIILLILISVCFNTVNAQENTSDFWNHVRFGGGVGLSFGDGFFSGTLAPSAIYEFNNQFALGLGLNGTYNSRKNFYKSTIFGGSLIGLFQPINEVQLSAEFEELNVNRKWEDNLGIEDQNYWYPALFIGAGYRTQNVTFGIRYDVLYDEDKSIYADPWMPFVRFYF